MKQKKTIITAFILILAVVAAQYPKANNLSETKHSGITPALFNQADSRPDKGKTVTIHHSAKDKDKAAQEPAFTTDSLFSRVKGDTLIAMQVFDEKSDDPYIRYGYEFSGHCYNCTMVDFLITSDKIVFIHACIPEKNKSYPFKLIESHTDGFVIRTGNKLEFHFERSIHTPILKVRVKGYTGKDAQGYPEFGSYYTTSTELHRFAVCDCGDFDG